LEEIVHIIPIGYEFDRVVAPFRSGYKVNRVYLLSSIEDIDAPTAVLEKHQFYVDKVRKELEGLGIIVIQVPTNLIEYLALIQVISKIVIEEKQKGNLVYINMSGAGRLTSVASTLVGMVHNVKVYYVDATGYADKDPRMTTHGYSIVEGTPNITMLANFQINMPNEIQLKALVKIYENEGIKTIDLIEYLGSEGFGDYSVDYYSLSRNEKTALIMKFNRNVVDKLSDSSYITKIKLGRENAYKITNTGKYIASISGLM
jgi:hypothetical protein